MTFLFFGGFYGYIKNLCVYYYRYIYIYRNFCRLNPHCSHAAMALEREQMDVVAADAAGVPLPSVAKHGQAVTDVGARGSFQEVRSLGLFPTVLLFFSCSVHFMFCKVLFWMMFIFLLLNSPVRLMCSYTYKIYHIFWLASWMISRSQGRCQQTILMRVCVNNSLTSGSKIFPNIAMYFIGSEPSSCCNFVGEQLKVKFWLFHISNLCW